MTWSLATVKLDGPTACIEVGDGLYRLGPSLARTGFAGASTLIDLFVDWDRSRAALDKAAALVRAEDRVPSGTERLAPLLYPGKVLCAGANYYDHLKEMGVPDTSSPRAMRWWARARPCTCPSAARPSTGRSSLPP
jgi:2-keto-4-pentenoate hydratase/2-oxohepta-3-ene-1,7-dioic acid hydratase in catechol pathway